MKLQHAIQACSGADLKHLPTTLTKRQSMLTTPEADTTAIALPADYEHHRMIDMKTSRAAQHRINLFVANADSTPMLRELFAHSQWSIYYSIGYWAWELEKFPSEWMVHLRLFNEATCSQS